MRRPISTVIIGKDRTVTGSVQESLKHHCDKVTVAGSAEDYHDGVPIIEKAAPDIVFLGVHDVQKGIEEIQYLSTKYPRVSVVACASEKTLDHILSLIAAGAVGYLPCPIAQEQLEQTLQKVERIVFAPPPVGQAPTGEVIAVYSPIGGVGTTTVAVNLAAALAADGSKVALIDLNLYAGDVDVFLKIHSPYTLSDLTNNIGRIDTHFIMGVMTHHPSGPYVLTMPLSVDEMLSVTPDQIHSSLKSLKGVFRYVVVDCIGQLTACNLAIFQSSSRILFTTTLSLQALKNTSRYLSSIKKKGFSDDRVKLVINRYLPKSGITIHNAEEILNKDTFQVIQDNEPDALVSLTNGVPIVNFLPRSPISKDICELSQRLRH